MSGSISNGGDSQRATPDVQGEDTMSTSSSEWAQKFHDSANADCEAIQLETIKQPPLQALPPELLRQVSQGLLGPDPTPTARALNSFAGTSRKLAQNVDTPLRNALNGSGARAARLNGMIPDDGRHDSSEAREELLPFSNPTQRATYLTEHLGTPSANQAEFLQSHFALAEHHEPSARSRLLRGVMQLPRDRKIRAIGSSVAPQVHLLKPWERTEILDTALQERDQSSRFAAVGGFCGNLRNLRRGDEQRDERADVVNTLTETAANGAASRAQARALARMGRDLDSLNHAEHRDILTTRNSLEDPSDIALTISGLNDGLEHLQPELRTEQVVDALGLAVSHGLDDPESRNAIGSFGKKLQHVEPEARVDLVGTLSLAPPHLRGSLAAQLSDGIQHLAPAEAATVLRTVMLDGNLVDDLPRLVSNAGKLNDGQLDMVRNHLLQRLRDTEQPDEFFAADLGDGLERLASSPGGEGLRSRIAALRNSVVPEEQPAGELGAVKMTAPSGTDVLPWFVNALEQPGRDDEPSDEERSEFVASVTKFGSRLSNNDRDVIVDQVGKITDPELRGEAANLVASELRRDLKSLTAPLGSIAAGMRPDGLEDAEAALFAHSARNYRPNDPDVGKGRPLTQDDADRMARHAGLADEDLQKLRAYAAIVSIRTGRTDPLDADDTFGVKATGLREAVHAEGAFQESREDHEAGKRSTAAYYIQRWAIERPELVNYLKKTIDEGIGPEDRIEDLINRATFD